MEPTQEELGSLRQTNKTNQGELNGFFGHYGRRDQTYNNQPKWTTNDGLDKTKNGNADAEAPELYLASKTRGSGDDYKKSEAENEMLLNEAKSFLSQDKVF
jgi:hypothetical protein